jgi:AcrR family transcriptional regulator
MPKGIPLTEEKLSARRSEICVAAIRLLLKKGFIETSMREIAEAAGVGKSTLYDYFASKDEILIAYVVEEVRQASEKARSIIAQDLSATEKIRRIMRQQLEFMLANKLLNLKLTFETQRLSQESLECIQVHRHAYQDMLAEVVEEGIRNGEFRPVNPLFAIRSIFSMMTPAVYTSRPTGTPEEMLEEVLDIAFNGILA